MINDLRNKTQSSNTLAVGTFMDSNGDGVGDFQGVVHRLDYLADLGICRHLARDVSDATWKRQWLRPFQLSRGVDGN